MTQRHIKIKKSSATQLGKPQSCIWQF